MRLSLKLVLAVLVALVAIGGTLGALAPQAEVQQADDVKPGGCTTELPGVTIVIETLDSKPAISCVSGFSGSGWQLLDSATAVEGTSNYPTGFACRINGYPSAEVQDCLDTPTYSEGSWAYFYADQTSEGWAFSGTGSAMRKPACGTSEAWVFTAANLPQSTKPKSKPVVFECTS
jgi:hypothetical protein